MSKCESVCAVTWMISDLSAIYAWMLEFLLQQTRYRDRERIERDPWYITTLKPEFSLFLLFLLSS